ncbi:hypothetical protein [Qipengyuania sp. ASV99]|uniref:hypothetical protein n=1 Tax=Qipengyuania sp. ASV99 TaxID=3399681 RepID=UPI003A4C55C9
MAAAFDIVNGFLNRCRGGIVAKGQTFGAEFYCDRYHHKINQIDYLAEIIFPHHRKGARSLYKAVVDGVDSQA